MATPIIQSTGSTSGAGTAGEGRNDLVIGETVTLSDTEAANSGASYLWEFEDIPIGSSTTLNNPATSTPDFTPDVIGSYRIKATVNGTDSSTEVLSVPLVNTGSRVPSFEEQLEYDAGGNDKGWHEALTSFMRNGDNLLEDTLILPAGDRRSHNSNTPLVVGAVAFNPNDVPGSPIVKFRAVFACGTSPLTVHVKLHNISDGEDVTGADLTLVDTTATTKVESAALTIGAAAGNIKNSEKIYEVQIFLDSAPADPETETIELYSAELRITRTA